MAKKEETKKEEHTKYERARLLGSRALQISMGAPFLVKLEEKDLEKIHYNPLTIARMEYDEGVIPMTIRRPLPEAHKEFEEKA